MIALQIALFMALAATALWFAAFISLAESMSRETAGKAPARLDAPARSLLTAARAAFAVGIGSVVVLSSLGLLHQI